ncbi:MAG: hypothetical protein IJ486_07340 [Firmicutes bacterium]|nr:hypothetical protein [Bacillota bacterium]
MMWKPLLLIVIMVIIFYILYQNGYMVTKAIRSIKFIGTERGKKASFKACTGTLKRIVRFRESRIYTFTLYTELEKGKVELYLLDSEKNEVLKLDQMITEEAVMLDGVEKYTMVIKLESASGYYEIEWE